MPKKKKGKKGKKGNKGPEILTTGRILKERARCMCPRFGDSYTRTTVASSIKVDLAYHRIKKTADKKLSVLDLSGCGIPFVFDEIRMVPVLGECLLDLNLARNSLFNSDSVFVVLEHLQNLKRLSLANNFLNGKLSELSGSLPHLEELDVDGNQLTALPASCGNWSNLKVFSCGGNGIKELPDGAENWEKLEMCNLRENDFSVIPAFISKWKRMKRLFLGSNKFKEVPEEIGELVELVELDLRKNELTILPDGLKKCVEIEHLNLGDNKLTELPQELIVCLTKIRDLYLYRNKIESLPANIGVLRNCERLSVSKNNLKSLPETVGECENLKELYLNGNAKFNSLPNSIGSLKVLRELGARGCPKLKSLPKGVEECDNLVELDVRSGGKKDVCKVPPEVTGRLENKDIQCKIRGVVVKKGKKGKGGKKK